MPAFCGNCGYEDTSCICVEGPHDIRCAPYPPGYSPPKPNGGPAYPRHNVSPNHYGMSLRDAFAIAAVQSVSCGIIAEANRGTSAKSLAAAAFEIADAMLEESKK